MDTNPTLIVAFGTVSGILLLTLVAFLAVVIMLVRRGKATEVGRVVVNSLYGTYGQCGGSDVSTVHDTNAYYKHTS